GSGGRGGGSAGGGLGPGQRRVRGAAFHRDGDPPRPPAHRDSPCPPPVAGHPQPPRHHHPGVRPLRPPRAAGGAASPRGSGRARCPARGTDPGAEDGARRGGAVGGPRARRPAGAARAAGAAAQRADRRRGGSDSPGWYLPNGGGPGMAPPLTPGRPLELCAFWVGSAVYAIDVARVDEVLPRVVPLPVPGLPEHFEGVVHLQGATVPIVDLRRLLPAGTPPRTAKQKILV